MPVYANDRRKHNTLHLEIVGKTRPLILCQDFLCKLENKILSVRILEVIQILFLQNNFYISMQYYILSLNFFLLLLSLGRSIYLQVFSLVHFGDILKKYENFTSCVSFN